jgi:hypothetical protein
MSGSLIGGVVGGVIGFVIGGPAGAQWGWLAGSTLGSLVDQKGNPGPNFADLRPQSSEYGRPIPIIYSIMAVGGNVIWASDLVKTGDGGGKGGDGGGTGPTYAANFAVLICESSGDKKLGRIWAGPEKRLIYDPATATLESGSLRFYDGADDQLPDPLMESYLGAGNVPAYRGFAFVMLEGFDVSAHDGNRIPFLMIEVGGIDANVVSNDAPANLGTTWAVQLMESSTHFLTVYMGSYQGVLKTEKATGVTVQNRLISVLDIGAADAFFYDSARDVVIHLRHNLNSITSAGVLYASLSMAADTITNHTFTIADGDATAGAAMVAGNYVFAFNNAGAGHYIFYVVNPATGAVTSSVTIAGTATLRDIYSFNASTNAVYGITTDGAVYFDLTAGTVTALGAAASTNAGTSSRVDPDTGYLWSVARDGGVLNYTVYSPSALIVSDSVATTFNELARVPIVTGGGYVRVIGNEWLAVVYSAVFDATTGAVVSFGPTLNLDGISPLYVGTGIPDAGVYINSAHPTQTWPEYVFWIGDNLGTGSARTDMALGIAGTGYLGAVGSATIGSATLTYQTLAEVVTDLSLRAGLTEDDIDVSQLTDQVDGYPIANQMTVKDAIVAMMPAYFFDAVESQGKIKFVKRGGSIAAVIPEEDLGAHPSGEDAEAKEAYHTTRVMDDELPHTLNITYVLAATKYSPDTKYSRRLIGHSGDEATHEYTMVFTGEKAQQIADVDLHNLWVERLGYKFSLPRKYGYLEPTDIVGIAGYTMRITKQTEKDGYYECEAVHDDSNIYTPNVIVTETPPPDETVVQPSLTLLELM